jgi:tetratricopeptide (TPR) repeat protein
MTATVCLNMIVKNEAHVIRRCLDSVRPFIDSYLIVDTGSTDGTQDIIRAHLAELPGEVVERPWRDFGTNRSEALELARGRADYTLIIDADEVFEAPPGFRWPRLVADAYQILHRAGTSETTFYLTQLVRSTLPFRYVGVLHEVITCDVPHQLERLEGPVTHGLFDSARTIDPVAKYRRDAAVLEAALRDEPGNARYVFYLAQSLRDAGELQRSIETYERRVKLGGWAEEVWYSLYQIANLKDRTGCSTGEVVVAHLEAFRFRPSRAEPLVQVARRFRESGSPAMAYPFASAAVKIPIPEDILFLERSFYGWRAQDELAISAYYAGRYEESLAANDQLLQRPDLPSEQRERVQKNRRFSIDALAKVGRRV